MTTVITNQVYLLSHIKYVGIYLVIYLGIYRKSIVIMKIFRFKIFGSKFPFLGRLTLNSKRCVYKMSEYVLVCLSKVRANV